MPIESIMWNGTCNHLSFPEQLRAARLSGCDVLSVAPYDLRRRLERGWSIKQMLSRADDEGVRISHVNQSPVLLDASVATGRA
jgi:hypothetical protein